MNEEVEIKDIWIGVRLGYTKDECVSKLVRLMLPVIIFSNIIVVTISYGIHSGTLYLYLHSEGMAIPRYLEGIKAPYFHAPNGNYRGF